MGTGEFNAGGKIGGKIGVISLTMAQTRQFKQDFQEGIIVNSVSKCSGSV